MMRSLYSGLSGLKGHQTGMDVIGNNISNVNTVGFKTGRATFADVFSQNLKAAASGSGNVGGTNPKQIGLGTNVGAIDTIFRDGSIQETGKNTDLALSGDALFVVRYNDKIYYTRDGAFEFDAAGNYVLPGSGHVAQGWMATDGVIDTTAAVSDITVQKGQAMAAKPTSEVDFKYNLDADTPLIEQVEGGYIYQTRPVSQTQWEEVGEIGVLEEEESLYNLSVKIGNNDYLLHGVGNMANHEEDIDLSKNWKVQSVGEYPEGGYNWPITLADDDDNTSTIYLVSNGNSDIKEGDVFSTDTSRLRLKSTVNEKSPLEFNVDGVNYKAVGMGHSVEIPGQDWYVSYAGGNSIVIEQRPNGVSNGCSVNITLEQQKDADGNLIPLSLPAVNSKLEFAGDAYTATKLRPVTVTTYETVKVYTDGAYKTYNSVPLETTVNIYDSLGNLHNVPVYFTREGDITEDGTMSSVNKWLVSLDKNAAANPGNVGSYTFTDAAGNNGTITMPTVEIQFDSSGKLLTNDGADITGLMTLTLDADATGASGETTDGAAAPVAPAPQTITVDFSELTQFSGSNTISGYADGNVAGTLKEIQISNSGIITGIYTNGVSQEEAQVAVANFTNMPGLTKTGTSMYQESDNSGVPVIDTPEKFGATLTAGALEMSNVDIANEFADMIVKQRGFQANSKIITVGDEMIETAVNMKR